MMPTHNSSNFRPENRAQYPNNMFNGMNGKKFRKQYLLFPIFSLAFLLHGLPSVAQVELDAALMGPPCGTYGNGVLSGAALSPDGRYMVSTSSSGIFFIWDAQTGQVLHRVESVSNTQRAIAFTPDSSKFATGHSNGTVRVWNAETGVCLKVIDEWDLAIEYLEFFSDSVRLLVVGNRCVQSCDYRPVYISVHIVDTNTGAILSDYWLDYTVNKAVLTIDETKFITMFLIAPTAYTFVSVDLQSGEVAELCTINADSYSDFVLTPDNSKVITYSSNGLVRVWNLATGQLIQSLKKQSDDWERYLTLSVSPDNCHVLIGTGGYGILWDMESNSRVGHLRSARGGSVRSLGFNVDGTMAFTTNSDAQARLWDLRVGNELRSLSLQEGSISKSVLTPNGNLILVLREDGQFSVFDISEDTQPTPLQPVNSFNPYPESTVPVVFSASQTIVVTAVEGMEPGIWEIRTGTLIASLGEQQTDVNVVDVSTDETKVVTGGDDGYLRLWDAGTGELLNEFIIDTSQITAIEFSYDDTKLAFGASDGSIQVIELETGEVLEQAQSEHGPATALEIHSRGYQLTAGFEDGLIQDYNFYLDEFNSNYESHTSAVKGLKLSPLSSTLLSYDEDGEARLWMASYGGVQAELRGESSEIVGADYTPDGQIIATVCKDGHVIFWDAINNEVVQVFPGHNNDAYSVAMSPDGNTVMTGGRSNEVLLWDVETGELIRNLAADDYAHLIDVAFSPDGSEALVGASRCVRLIDLTTFQDIREFSIARDSYSLCFSQDGTKVLTGYGRLYSDELSEAVLWDRNTGEIIQRFLTGEGRNDGAAITPDESRVLTHNSQEGLRVWDVSSGEILYAIEHVFAFALSPDGQTIAISKYNENLIELLDIETQEVQESMELPFIVEDFSYSPDGRWLAVNYYYDIVILDVEHGLLPLCRVDTTYYDGGRPNSISFTPDGQGLLSTHDDGLTRLWCLEGIENPIPTNTPSPTPQLEPGIEQLPVAAGPEAVGITPLTGDVNLWAENGGGREWWRPEADTLSNGNAIVLGGMRKEPGSEITRDMIAIFSPSGELLDPARAAFFTNAGEPWENTICTSRNSDKFYGLCADTVSGRNGARYVVHTIANPDAFPEAFPDYPPEQFGEYHTAIQVIRNDGVPETNLINPWGGYITEPGLIRGGTVRFLSNGNIVVNFEDRTAMGAAKDALYNRDGNKRVVGAVILAPDGSIVKAPFAISNPSSSRNSENRFGLTSGDGWFAVRYYDALDGSSVVAFDNDGNELGGGMGRIYPALDIPELLGLGGQIGGGRGDENGLEAAGDRLYISFIGADQAGYLTQFQVGANGLSVLKSVRFTDHPLSTFEHNADLGVDSDGNVIVMWQDQSWERFQTGRWEMLARMFDSNLEPITSSFCMFEVGNNTDVDSVDPVLGPGRTKQARITMNDDIIIAIALTNEVPYGDASSATGGSGEQWYTYTYIARVLQNPAKPAVEQWELY